MCLEEKLWQLWNGLKTTSYVRKHQKVWTPKKWKKTMTIKSSFQQTQKQNTHVEKIYTKKGPNPYMLWTSPKKRRRLLQIVVATLTRKTLDTKNKKNIF
jgi:hypothetical protein